MPEKTIFHPGLRAYRVIRGNEATEVEFIAKWQMEIWEERWRKIKAAQDKREKDKKAALLSTEKKEYAQRCTRDAERQLESLSRILREGIELDHAVDWESLKHRIEFAESPPMPTEPQKIPIEPQPNESRFIPKLGLFDHLIPSRARTKVSEFHNYYLAARASWELERDRIEEANRLQTVNHEKKISEWEERKTAHHKKQTLRDEEVVSLRAAYEAKKSDAVIEYYSHVLSTSEYPEGFPKSFALDYIAQTQMLVIEYELPDIETLPKLKELKSIATRDELREANVSESWLNKTYDDVLYQICLRTIYEIFQSDTADTVVSVVFNGWVNYVDKSNGQEVKACILTLEALRGEFGELNLAKVDPKECFRSLKGVSGSKLATRSAVRPILQLNRKDKRFVASHD